MYSVTRRWACRSPLICLRSPSSRILLQCEHRFMFQNCDFTGTERGICTVYYHFRQKVLCWKRNATSFVDTKEMWFFLSFCLFRKRFEDVIISHFLTMHGSMLFSHGLIVTLNNILNWSVVSTPRNKLIELWIFQRPPTLDWLVFAAPFTRVSDAVQIQLILPHRLNKTVVFPWEGIIDQRNKNRHDGFHLLFPHYHAIYLDNSSFLDLHVILASISLFSEEDGAKLQSSHFER